MEEFNTKDATGKEIVFGKKYGYSNSENGFTNVRIGTAAKFTEKGYVSLIVEKATTALYNHEAKKDEFFKKDLIFVKPAMLFKL